MITGTVNALGVPAVTLNIAGKAWPAVIDTGFNGDLELPSELRSHISARRMGSVRSVLAGGQLVVEERYELDLPFDGQVIFAETTFVPDEYILIGTHLLRRHRLVINFATKDVLVERVG